MEDLNPAKRVTPRPGDRFVIETEHHLPSSAPAAIARYVAKSLGVSPDDVLVLDGGMALSVVSPCDPRREADLLDANNRMHERNVRLSSAIMAAVIQFRFYEAQHRAKGTPEADAKAEVNRQLAEQLDCVALGQGTTVGAPWRQFALAHQLAANLHGMLEAHVENTGEALEADDAALVAEWVRQLDDVGQIALDKSVVGELTISLKADATAYKGLTRALDFMAWVAKSPVLGSEDEELDAAALSQHAQLELESIMRSLGEEAPPQDAAYKPTAMTEAGSIAAGGSALVRAFIENVGFAYKAQDNEALLRDFSAFAVDQLKARTMGADFQITPPPKPSDASAVVTVDFGKGGGMQGFRRTETMPDGTVVDLTTVGDQ